MGRRRHEIGRTGRFADVLVRRRTALSVIALQQRFRRGAAQHAIKLPGDILGVFQARIGATRAERPAWNGGSNQNQRSFGNSAAILTSAIRNWSSNTCPANSAPTICRSDERAPSQATTEAAFTW